MLRMNLFRSCVFSKVFNMVFTSNIPELRMSYFSPQMPFLWTKYKNSTTNQTLRLLYVGQTHSSHPAVGKWSAQTIHTWTVSYSNFYIYVGLRNSTFKKTQTPEKSKTQWENLGFRYSSILQGWKMTNYVSKCGIYTVV